jgi:hypothetical protein
METSALSFGAVSLTIVAIVAIGAGENLEFSGELSFDQG